MEKSEKLLKNPFFDDIKKVHFIGIGGISLSALARLSNHFGLFVSGSDCKENSEVKRLKQLGIQVSIPHQKGLLKSCDLVVYSGAIGEDNPERVEAKSRGIKQVERSVYLNEISKMYDYVIAVAGTHGKSTTTAMIANIFVKAKLNPTVHIGAETKDFGNLRIGDEKVFITEACEYRNSMSTLEPNICVVTNIDDDHLDYFKTRKNLIKAFQNFEAKAKNYSIVYSERNFRKVSRKNILFSVGFNNNQDIIGCDFRKIATGYKFRVCIQNEKFAKFKLNMYGRHNILNAVFAIAVAKAYGIKKRHIKKGIKSFKGLARRYEIIGKYRDTIVMSDYAHHPTAVIKSLSGLKEHFKNALVVFQPHTYSRTENLLEEFSTAFKEAKNVIIYPTYPAREKYNKKGDALTLYNAITNKKKYLVQDDNELKYTINRMLKKSKCDIILFMGAGDLCERITQIISINKR